MNRKLLALLMAAITLPVAAAQYVKPGAVLTLNPGQNNAEFNINASTGDGSGVCNMEGTAQQIAAGESQKHRWIWNDNASQCVAIISELNNGKTSVMTRGCEGYCGALATGTMDGLFNKK
ncbi:acyl-CoA dehydrogenase [Salmonella enterica subsp. diarizonae]|nr:acyl-CoA dehydrogenase [Salmonella enterica subsp. diarizonae]EAS4985175.1 acyl-CoA dehydrogenase [Salmonella enterica]HCM1873497.1 acyl-CoA dehydrogenase [Salmonella enterica subsp. diarizonae serovar 53:z10:z35]EBT9640688.1 acyl-CoA dehydrogenase [Salmonella enterica]ECC1576855.1 acyl-CoA dehydrogenase [Salmonella enterica subsp. diarizonae]